MSGPSLRTTAARQMSAATSMTPRESLWSTSQRPTECQVDAQAAKRFVLALLQFGYAVVPKPRRTAPHRHIAVPDREFPHAIAAFQPAELEGGRQPQRHGDDWVRVVALVFVLMQRQPGAGLVTVDQACIGRETRVAGILRGAARQSPEAVRHRRPWPAALRVDPIVA